MIIGETEKKKRLKKLYRLGNGWVLGQVLCVLYVWATLEAISYQDVNFAYGLASIYLAFLAIAVGIYGVHVLKDKLLRNHYHVGIFIGTSFMMSAATIISFLLTFSGVAYKKAKGGEHWGWNVSEVFAMIFGLGAAICYAVYGYFLYKDRSAVILLLEDLNKKTIYKVALDENRFTRVPNKEDPLNASLAKDR